MSWSSPRRYKIEKKQRCGIIRYVSTMANRIKTRDQGLRRKAAGGNARAGWGPTANSGERNLEFILKGLITQSVI